jgi:hypothetical protein
MRGWGLHPRAMITEAEAKTLLLVAIIKKCSHFVVDIADHDFSEICQKSHFPVFCNRKKFFDRE